jgi:hypothetical protein
MKRRWRKNRTTPMKRVDPNCRSAAGATPTQPHLASTTKAPATAMDPSSSVKVTKAQATRCRSEPLCIANPT